MKSTRGFALKSTHGIAIKSTNLASGEGAALRRNTRQFYDGEESCYIIDAKLEGNLGRYLNVRDPGVPPPWAWPGLAAPPLPGSLLAHPWETAPSLSSDSPLPGDSWPRFLTFSLALCLPFPSIAAAPTSSSRTSSWTRTTSAFPGWPSSPASKRVPPHTHTHTKKSGVPLLSRWALKKLVQRLFPPRKSPKPF